jgi:uncharacterized protein YrzB (UPF0473 family)
MNNKDMTFLTEINTMAQSHEGVKHLIHDKEITNRIIELVNQYGRESVYSALTEIKEAA